MAKKFICFNLRHFVTLKPRPRAAFQLCRFLHKISSFCSSVNYSSVYPDVSKRTLNINIEDHNGTATKYIIENYCPSVVSTASEPLKTWCMDLAEVVDSDARIQIDNFIKYVKEVRAKIDEALLFLGSEQIKRKKFLLSDGAGAFSCFPLNQTGVFTYNDRWHREIFRNGKLPDGIEARYLGSSIGTWMVNDSRIEYTSADKSDTSHLSHIDVTVEGDVP